MKVIKFKLCCLILKYIGVKILELNQMKKFRKAGNTDLTVISDLPDFADFTDFTDLTHFSDFTYFANFIDLFTY